MGEFLVIRWGNNRRGWFMKGGRAPGPFVCPVGLGGRPKYALD